jgi:hypothetical protein
MKRSLVRLLHSTITTSSDLKEFSNIYCAVHCKEVRMQKNLNRRARLIPHCVDTVDIPSILFIIVMMIIIVVPTKAAP